MSDNKYVAVVENGCFQGLFDLRGNEIGCSVIDYDDDSTECPICREEREFVDDVHWKFIPCETCGYDDDKDNWVEAVQNMNKEK